MASSSGGAALCAALCVWHGESQQEFAENEGFSERVAGLLVWGRPHRGRWDALGRLVRLVRAGIRVSVVRVVEETQNADKSRTTYRSDLGDSDLRACELDDHFCADHHVASRAVYAGAPA